MSIKETVLNALDEMKIRHTWHSFKDVPNTHCFATYDIPERRFFGSDDVVFFCESKMFVTFFFRGDKTDSDFETEEKFERAVIESKNGDFTSSSGYDSDNKLFFTTYNMEFTEQI